MAHFGYISSSEFITVFRVLFGPGFGFWVFPAWAPFAVVLFSGYVPSQSCLLGPIPRGRVSHVMARGLLVYARHLVDWFTLVSSMELEQSRMRNPSLLYV